MFDPVRLSPIKDHGDKKLQKPLSVLLATLFGLDLNTEDEATPAPIPKQSLKAPNTC